MFEAIKIKVSGLISCIIVALTSIQLSEYLGIHLLEFEKKSNITNYDSHYNWNIYCKL